MTFDHAGRADRARREMAERGVDVLLLSVGSDLPYLFGYRAVENERLTMGVLPVDGPATLVVPELEVPRVEEQPGLFEIRAWGEQEDPVEIVAELAAGARSVLVGDQTWSRFTLALERRLGGTTFLPAGDLMSRLRVVKEPAELELLQAAGAAVDRVAHRLAGHRFTGSSERRLAGEIAAMTVEEGSDEATFTIVASGPNAASPHHEPGDRVIERGDAVVVDFGGKVGGYCSDTTRTFVAGAPSHELVEVHAVVAAAQQAARAAAKPGAAAGDVDAAARSVIAGAGYGDYFIHRVGHGIGLDVHEDPYLVDGNETPLEPGMTFSIEPGVYLPRRFGVRIEDIVACNGDGVAVFNDSPRELIAVE